MVYEIQGAESDDESTPEIMLEHGEIEANDAQEYTKDVQDEEPNPEAIGVSVHEVHVNKEQTNESRTENETNAEEVADTGDELIEEEQGATYNLRNRVILQAPRRLIEVLDNLHSTKAYETPTVLLQSVLKHVTGDCGGD